MKKISTTEWYGTSWIFYDPNSDRLFTASLADSHQFPHWVRICEL